MPTLTPSEGSREEAAGGSTAGSLNVLIVENHLETRQSVEIFLRVLGHRSSGVAGMEAALALSGQTHFDVLLSDLRLPDGDGCDLLRRLDAQGRRPRSAIAMSGLGGPSDHVRSREAGFEVLLVKPFAPEALVEALDRARPAPPGALPQEKTTPALPRPRPAAAVPAAPWAQRLHDNLCQQLAAAALWQGVLVRRLEMMTQSASALTLAAEDTGETAAVPAGPLEDALNEAEQVARLLDDALTEARALMREMREGEKPLARP